MGEQAVLGLLQELLKIATVFLLTPLITATWVATDHIRDGNFDLALAAVLVGVKVQLLVCAVFVVGYIMVWLLWIVSG